VVVHSMQVSNHT